MFARLILPLLIYTLLFGDTLRLVESHFIFEDDVDFKQDYDYSFGAELGSLYELYTHKKQTPQKFLSLSYVWQIYTPRKFRLKELLEDDRPYAGLQYLKGSYHLATSLSLHSYSLIIGILGPLAMMEQVQNGFHKLIGAPLALGWPNQLANEPIFELNYGYKRLFALGQKSLLLPTFALELGNAWIRLSSTLLFRFGDNAKSSFGESMIDPTFYHYIPRSYAHPKASYKVSYQLYLKSSWVIIDITLDGNSFQPSHFVPKNPLLFHIGYGITLRKSHWSFSYLRDHRTKEFPTQNRYPNYGSLIFSYRY